MSWGLLATATAVTAARSRRVHAPGTLFGPGCRGLAHGRAPGRAPPPAPALAVKAAAHRPGSTAPRGTVGMGRPPGNPSAGRAGWAPSPRGEKVPPPPPASGAGKHGARAPTRPPPAPSSSSPRQRVQEALDAFLASPSLLRKAASYGVPEELCRQARPLFRERLLADQLPYLPWVDVVGVLAAETTHPASPTNSKRSSGSSNSKGRKAKGVESEPDASSPAFRFLSAPFLRFLHETQPHPGSQLHTLLQLSNSATPEQGYPEARALQRRIIMHVGPTNSGKTHAALQRLMQAESGVYCGPLRLLAHEIYDTFNRQGVACNLVTGEERRVSDDVSRTSCTVEMADLERELEVAVMDEIQMIADPDRGWAWTTAFLGLRAREIHLCGEPSAVPVIRRLVQSTKDQLEVVEYGRLTSLSVERRALGGSLQHVRRGDCIVAFSRRQIFALKRALELSTKLKAAVIYGNLPPETRAEQARLFNDPQGPYDVLIASDAIGMGLNLHIQRVVFMAMEKWNGKAELPLSVSQTKQIAGRAGRFNTAYEQGLVTTFHHADLSALRATMAQNAPEIRAAGLAPTSEQIRSLHALLPEDSLPQLLGRYEDLALISGNYFLCDLRNQKTIATLLQPLEGLNIEDRYTFALSPTKCNDAGITAALLHLATCRAERGEARVDEVVQLPARPPTDSQSLQDLESQHKLLILYLWLSQRMPETFVDDKKAMYLKRKCEHLIADALSNMVFQRAPRRRPEEREREHLREGKALREGQRPDLVREE